MRGAVVALDFEKEVLQFAERAPVNGGGEFFRRAGELGLPPAKQARNVICVTLNREKPPLGCDGGFEIADALIRVLQPDRFGGLRISQGVQVRGGKTRSERDFTRRGRFPKWGA